MVQKKLQTCMSRVKCLVVALTNTTIAPVDSVGAYKVGLSGAEDVRFRGV